VPRYRISVEYDGGPFVGRQRQDTGPSIQAALEDAVFAFTGERVHVQGAGRTDAGVHARGQVAHFDLAAEKPTDEVRGAINFHLKPHPIVVPIVERAAPGFHARFSATWRRYRYRILNRRAPAALDRGQVWHVPVPLDTAAMVEAAAVLVGHHDFNSFRSVACQSKTSIKTLDVLSVQRDGEEIDIEVDLELDVGRIKFPVGVVLRARAWQHEPAVKCASAECDSGESVAILSHVIGS